MDAKRRERILGRAISYIRIFGHKREEVGEPIAKELEELKSNRFSEDVMGEQKKVEEKERKRGQNETLVMYPTPIYRSMIYVALATIHLYSYGVEIKKVDVDEFRRDYPEIIKRTFDEVLELFQYELSYLQVDKAIYAYLCGLLIPQNVEATKTYKLGI